MTSGSNGSCGSYLCTATAKYDGPTGNGTPNGYALAALNNGWTANDAYVAVPAGYQASVNVTLQLPTYPANTTFSLSNGNLPPGVTASWLGGAFGSDEATVTFTAAASAPQTERTVTITNTLPGGQVYETTVELMVGACVPVSETAACTAVAQCGGSVANGCGGWITCETWDCPTGNCSLNHCCMTGTTWIAGKCTVPGGIVTCPTGYSYCGAGCVKGKCT